MKKVEFKFVVGQPVTTVFGDAGIVEVAAIDDGLENKYFVKQSNSCTWFKESELKEK